MRTLIAAGLILVAGTAWADTAEKPGATEQQAQASASSAAGLTSAPNVPPEIAAWKGTSFYPNEFCYKIYNMDRSIPQYWQIRRWCDKQERRGSGDFF